MSTNNTPKKAGQSEALVLLLNDIEADLENLRDLIAKFETSSMGYVTADMLALACWRLEYARHLAEANRKFGNDLLHRGSIAECGAQAGKPV